MWIWQYIKSVKPNFHQVTPTLYRSAQPSRNELIKYKKLHGIECVLNLRHDAGRKEREDAEAADLMWVHVPMLDDARPSDFDVSRALGVMRSGTVLVCCKGGRHRTGLMVAVYRVVEQGWTKVLAWKECNERGWYDHGGHEPIRLWFEAFDPERFR